MSEADESELRQGLEKYGKNFLATLAATSAGGAKASTDKGASATEKKSADASGTSSAAAV